MKARAALLGTMAVAWGLPPDGVAQEPPEWRLSAEPLLQIGVVEGEHEYQLFNAVSSVRLDDGRIAVLNAGTHELRIYDAEGRIAGIEGREGNGPGEFAVPVRLYRVGRDSLMVYDRGNVRFSVHTLDGTFVRTERAVHERGRSAYDEWLYDRSWIDGPTLGRGRGPVRAAIEKLPEPDAKVAYRYVKVSPQGHLWVRQPGRPGAAVAWIVYDLAARPIGRMTTPAKFEIHEIGRDYVLGSGRDELDVEYIQLFALAGAEHAPAHSFADADTAGAPQPRPVPDDLLREMRGTLRQLATRQEMFYSNGNFTYAGDVEQLEDWLAPEELLVRIVNAGPREWTGLIIDRRTGVICGMSMGAFAPVGWVPGTVTCQ